MNYCTICGEKIKTDARTCIGCGADVIGDKAVNRDVSNFELQAAASSRPKAETKRERKRRRKKARQRAAINWDRLAIGCILIGFAIFEFSTMYFTNKFLMPYQVTNLLRTLAANGVFPIVIGAWGVRELYEGIKRAL